MNEKERRQFLFKIFKSIESKRGSLSFICTTFKINKRSLYKAKVELETGDIWHSGDAIRRKKGMKFLLNLVQHRYQKKIQA